MRELAAETAALQVQGGFKQKSNSSSQRKEVPFFPLGGFTPLQSSTLSAVADRLGATPMQVALAWLLHRSLNILLIPGTSSVSHLRENLAAGQLTLSPQTLAELDGMAAAAGAVQH